MKVDFRKWKVKKEKFWKKIYKVWYSPKEVDMEVHYQPYLDEYCLMIHRKDIKSYMLEVSWTIRVVNNKIDECWDWVEWYTDTQKQILAVAYND